jgi:FMN reductase
MTGPSLVVVSAGLSQPSSTRLLGDRLAAATSRALADADLPASVEVVELREHAQPLVNHLLTGFPSEELQAVIDRVVGADGLIAVTPVFSASYSGLFKVFFDVIERDALAAMPVLIGATGGTARHSLVLDHAMRPLFTYLGGAVTRTGVYASAEDWGASDAPTATGLAERIRRAGGELATAVRHRDRGATADPFQDPVPFDQLLRGQSSRP